MWKSKFNAFQFGIHLSFVFVCCKSVQHDCHQSELAGVLEHILPESLRPIVVARRSVDVCFDGFFEDLQGSVHVPFFAGHDGFSLQGL